MGKAVNLMLSGKRREIKNNENGGPTSTGNGGIQAGLKIKNASVKAGSPLNAGLSPDGQRRLAPGEKTNALF